MKINKFFETEYLVDGNTCDNFIFEKYSSEFFEIAKNSLKNNGYDIKSCVVYCDNEQIINGRL